MTSQSILTGRTVLVTTNQQTIAMLFNIENIDNNALGILDYSISEHPNYRSGCVFITITGVLFQDRRLFNMQYPHVIT